jgi:ribonuclease-3
VPRRLTDAAGKGGRSADELIGSERVLASVCEALIGAVYLTFGYERTAPAVVEAFEGEIEEALQSPDDFKSLLQEKLARRGDVVLYEITREDGPPHDRSFEAVAQVEGEEIGRGEGKSKKSAEQSAALAALTSMEND